MDNFDRYQYVYNNPVNYSDPDGRKACHHHANGAIAFAGGGLGAAAMGAGLMASLGTGAFLAAGVGVVSSYTGGGGACTTRMPHEKEALFLVLFPNIPHDTLNEQAISIYLFLHYYENYMKGHGPSFLGKLNNTELQLFLFGQMGVVQNNCESMDDMFPVVAYFLMREMVANPRSGVDMASFYHDQYGPAVGNPKNRRATSKWIYQANRATFSHDSWSRTYKRDYKATPKWWGDARGGVATLNAAGTWISDAAQAITGTILFSVANAITGTKNLDKPKKWRL